jgi:crotonobetainyl-CoA:carnitine CoA-transferase CaiB-like acyl-CoA transferase
MGVLKGVRAVEFEGLGPAPFCGMLLADLGAEVVLIERPDAASGPGAIFRRGKKAIALDLKKSGGRDAALKIVARADALIEGFRPGVMERLGLGPDPVRAVNSRLVYGRVTGWGQSGPLAQAAGHDLNYVGLSGAAWYASPAGVAPVPPPTLVGDVAGGALYLAIGLLAAILRARETGEGGLVDAAIVDGSAHMMNLLLSLRAAGGLPDERGRSMLDGAHFYGVYRCADGGFVSIGPLEPKFYAQLLEKLGLTGDPLLTDQFDSARWPEAESLLAAAFASEPRAHWERLLAGTDACFAPVLSPSEAAAHPHMAARGIYREIGGVLQTAAAPRFDGAPPAEPAPVPACGQHTDEILDAIGMTRAEVG